MLTAFDVATRVCPFGDGRFWPMGPIVPVSPHGQQLAPRFPTRPGKGLINEGGVAAQIYREYLRAGAPLGIDFRVPLPKTTILTFIDDELADYAEDVQALGPRLDAERGAPVAA